MSEQNKFKKRGGGGRGGGRGGGNGGGGKFNTTPKGQLISKCPFGVTKSTKKPTKFL